MGIAIILQLHAVIWVKILLFVAWIADTVRELTSQARGYARVQRLLVEPGGDTFGYDRFGKKHEIHLLKGSVVLRHWSWLRLGFDDGLHYVELFMRRDSPAPTWRRLQLIWRHAL